MARIQENQTYNSNPILEGALDASYSLGHSLPAPRRKTVQPREFPGIMNVINQGQGSQQQQQYQPTQPTQMSNTSISQLGTQTTPYGGSTKYEKFHPGVDIASKHGTNIPSFTPGTVTDIGVSPSFGNYVMVKDDHGSSHRYSHLHQAFVQKGQQLSKGSVVGSMGNTGNVYSLSGGDGTHLDYRIRDLYGKYVNPYSYLNEKYGQ